MELTESELRTLPYQLRRVVEILGLQKSIDFLEIKGGQTLRIPVHGGNGRESKSHLKKLLNAHEFELFVRAFNHGNESHKSTQMPRNNKLKAILRNRSIRAEKQDGASLRALAVKYQITARQVMNIIREDG